jgi:hypothetical protein
MSSVLRGLATNTRQCFEMPQVTSAPICKLRAGGTEDIRVGFPRRSLMLSLRSTRNKDHQQTTQTPRVQSVRYELPHPGPFLFLYHATAPRNVSMFRTFPSNIDTIYHDGQWTVHMPHNRPHTAPYHASSLTYKTHTSPYDDTTVNIPSESSRTALR